MNFNIKTMLPFAAISVIGLAVNPAIAADASYFKGKTMKIVIPYGPGGTYDKYGHTFSRHLGNHIPGNPNIILQHMPGAGGSKAMNFSYNIMAKDGLNMVVPLDNSVVNQMLRPKKMKYKTDKFRWLGSSNQTNVVMVVRSDTGVKTVMDMKNIAVIGATSGKSSSGYINPQLVWGLLGLKGRMVTGYKGSSRSILAMEQGEAQMAAFNWLAWASKVPHWFKGDKPFARAMVQVGAFMDPDLPNVPMLSDLVKSKDKPLVDFMSTAGALGRGLTLPPGVDPRILATLRKAYTAMNADKAFAAELKKKRLRLMASDGVVIQEIVSKALKSTTPEVVSRLRKVLYGGS
ncbi:tripartite tricarboxylate transporter substrate-binding protein [Alphaproteobacteria bacterium]|nr:tripartite tricarboxylate transporter substrate-binding protein [Alphaproteobacteria bacterium]